MKVGELVGVAFMAAIRDLESAWITFFMNERPFTNPFCASKAQLASGNRSVLAAAEEMILQEVRFREMGLVPLGRLMTWFSSSVLTFSRGEDHHVLSESWGHHPTRRQPIGLEERACSVVGGNSPTRVRDPVRSRS